MTPEQGSPEAFEQVGQALAQIAQSDLPPEVAQRFAQIAEMYAETVAMLEGGGEAPQGAQPVSPEQGASGNAVPVR